MTHDIVITGGTILDGTGTPAYRADIAIDGDRVTAISEAPLEGRRRIDASGKAVSPGFVDIHSHADFTLQRAPEAATQLAQGVTTLLGGNCGMSPFPLSARNRVRHEHMDFDLGGDDVTWIDFAGYAEAVAATRPAINLGMQVGHGTVRAAILGGEDRAPDDDELAQMVALVRTAAEQGVFGFSSGLIYPPGRFADRAEMNALVGEAARHGLLYSTHVRNETDAVVDAVDEALDTARTTSARLEVSHLKSMGPAAAGLSLVALQRIRDARAEGVDVACDVYPYTASSTSLASRLPSWALDGGAESLASRLADPDIAARAADGLRERFGRDIDPAGIVLAEVGEGPFHESTGRSIVEIGRERGTDAAEAAIAVLAAHGDVLIVNHAIQESDMRTVLQDPLTSVASDGWVLTADGAGTPHPRSFGTFSRVLGRYVRDEGLLALEEAVRKMSALPASRMGLVDRGRIAEGMRADIVVFDPEAVRDRSTFDEPWQLSAGVETVLVNGVVSFENGAPTGMRAGRVLRRTGDVASGAPTVGEPRLAE